MREIKDWCFDVPNNRTGREFMKNLVKWRNKKRFTVVKRGRHANRNSLGRLNHTRDVPVQLAQSFKVYLHDTPKINMQKHDLTIKRFNFYKENIKRDIMRILD